jgi:hypothetical protein
MVFNFGNYPILAISAIFSGAPSPHFLAFVANKALIQFDAWATLAWRLGGPWVAQGWPLGDPNPNPNPIPVGRGSQACAFGFDLANC